MVEAIITWSITGILVLFGLASACFPKTDNPKPTELPPGDDNPPIVQPVPGGTTTDTPTDTSDKTPTKTDSPKPTELPKDNPPITQPTPPSKPQTPPPRVVPEEEKFLIGLLPVLYSGDRGAIRQNLYIEGLSNNDIETIIDDMDYYKAAEKHSGYASAKVNKCENTTLDNKEGYCFNTTVTFKDGAKERKEFKVVKESSGAFKLY